MQEPTWIHKLNDKYPTLGPQFQVWKLNYAIYSSILLILQAILVEPKLSYSPSLAHGFGLMKDDEMMYGMY